MIRKVLTMSIFAGAALMSASAQAQFYWGPFGPRPPIVDDDYFRRPPGRIPAPYIDDAYNSGEVIGILRDEGFRSIAQPRRNGNVFVTTAVDPRGMRVRVVVDAFEGDIRSVTAIGPEKPRVAATPNPPTVETAPLAPPTSPANPLIAPGGNAGSPAANPRQQTKPAQPPQNNQSARPAPGNAKIVDPKKPDRIILPNPSSGNAALPPPLATPAPPAPVVVPAPQIATPAVPPVPAPEIAASNPPPVTMPAVPAVPPVVVPAPAPSAPANPNAATETLTLPPATAQ